MLFIWHSVLRRYSLVVAEDFCPPSSMLEPILSIVQRCWPGYLVRPDCVSLSQPDLTPCNSDLATSSALRCNLDSLDNFCSYCVCRFAISVCRVSRPYISKVHRVMVRAAWPAVLMLADLWDGKSLPIAGGNKQALR